MVVDSGSDERIALLAASKRELLWARNSKRSCIYGSGRGYSHSARNCDGRHLVVVVAI